VNPIQQNGSAKGSDKPVNINTASLITLTTFGAALVGTVELFAFHPDSELTEVAIRVLALAVFAAAGMFAVQRARHLQQQVLKELVRRDRVLEQLRSAEDYNRMLVENGQGLLCIHNLQGVLLSVNRSAADALGYSQRELTRRNLRDLVPETLRADFDGYLDRMRANTKDAGCMIVRGRNGVLMTWAYKNTLFTRANGERVVVGTAQDITEKARRSEAQKQTRTELEQTNYRLKEQTLRLGTYNQMLAHLPGLTHAMQPGATVLESVNLALPPLQKLFVDCEVGIYIKDPSSAVFNKVGESGRLQLKSVLTPSECSSLRDGRIRAIDPNCSTCLYSKRQCKFKGTAYTIPLQEHQEVIGLLVIEQRAGNMPDLEILQSASDHLTMMLRSKMLQEKLTEQSTRDELTGLLNRRFMEESFVASVARARRNGDPLSIVMLDIDHFKRLNDTFGHQAGDEALRLVSRVIQKSIRTEDVACRYGGEEFVLLMPGATLAIATAREESLRRAVAELDLSHIALGAKGITISAGVASYSSRMNNGTSLLTAADDSLYDAKNTGRNKVVQHRHLNWSEHVNGLAAVAN